MAHHRGRRLLNAVAGVIRRHVSLEAVQADAAALWAVHTYAVTRRLVETSPRLLVTAPPGSGKTTLLRVLGALSDTARMTLAPSPASIWRRLEVGAATFLIDEAHHVLQDPSPDLLAILDAGYEVDGTVPRCVRQGEAWVPVEYPVFAPVAMAMIGRPREVALLSRCVEVRLERRRRPRATQRTTREVLARYQSLRQRIVYWVDSVAGLLRSARPAIPHQLSDRTADLWAPLLAIADLAGGPWPDRAKRAARRLSAESERAAAAASVDAGLRLLMELREVCPAGLTIWPTADILRALASIEDAPWADWRGGMTAVRLARLLGEYAVSPRKVRLPGSTVTTRGYLVADLVDVWNRYLPPLRRPRQRSAVAGVAGVAACPVMDHGRSCGASRRPQGATS